ncbi:hypothetical protein BHE74_00026212 [Ensete ventricosum]|nr:hypothetical protein BHE74_00026212 [Ensete ventricosum]
MFSPIISWTNLGFGLTGAQMCFCTVVLWKSSGFWTQGCRGQGCATVVTAGGEKEVVVAKRRQGRRDVATGEEGDGFWVVAAMTKERQRWRKVVRWQRWVEEEGMAVRGKEDAGDGKRATTVVEGGRDMALKEDEGSDKGSNDHWLYVTEG